VASAEVKEQAECPFSKVRCSRRCRRGLSTAAPVDVPDLLAGEGDEDCEGRPHVRREPTKMKMIELDGLFDAGRQRTGSVSSCIEEMAVEAVTDRGVGVAREAEVCGLGCGIGAEPGDDLGGSHSGARPGDAQGGGACHMR
jgi:hypothetical protein